MPAPYLCLTICEVCGAGESMRTGRLMTRFRRPRARPVYHGCIDRQDTAARKATRPRRQEIRSAAITALS